MHKASEPSILYFGTPVVLITSQNPDGSFNIAPFSSAFWLGWRCIIGIGLSTQTASNLTRFKECVINLPSVNEIDIVNKLALTTGSNQLSERKQQRGYRYEPDKFKISGATAVASEIVSIPSILECPVHMEAIVTEIHKVAEDDDALKNRIVSVELKIVRIRLEESILFDGDNSRVDPDKWKPLIMSFQHFYGIDVKIGPSKLAEIPERLYVMK